MTHEAAPPRDAIRELEESDRLEEAAALAEQRGLLADAARLWEQACRFERAGDAALRAGDAARAVELASRAGDAALEARAIAALVATPDAAWRVARGLSEQGRHASAARLWLASGDASGAAESFERAGLFLDAATAHNQSGDPRGAARCLERAREDPLLGNQASVLLGALYLDHGRHEAALRVLQKIPREAPERAAALPHLRRALAALGLSDALRDLEAEAPAAVPTPAREPSAPAKADETVLFGRYRVVAEVARTPTARVLRAVDQLTSSEVAVKLFSAASLRDTGRDALKRFEREAVVLGQLRHPAIVPLKAYFPEGPAVILAWMAGGSLADLLEKDSVSPARAVEIASAVLAALSEAHRRGILHRDIKPANVLFDAAGAAYLADFGTAHVADAAQTVTSGLIGTLAYMAPEQRSGAPANAKSDIYGVGALLWHALTDAPPAAAMELPSDLLGEAECALVRRLIGPEAERPESAREARELLAGLRWPEKKLERRHASVPPESRRRQNTEGRLQALDAHRFRDTWLGRELVVLPTHGPSFERARAFAQADHSALAGVLAVQPGDDTVWVEVVVGTPLDGALSRAEHARLRDALEALHRAGGRHGAVDRAHVVRRGGDVVLSFPLTERDSAPEADLADLNALA
ncbi:MAG: protein kinase [Myxococcales bacterium]|nr:protein kinase [Myxococcales bacterium]